MDVSVLPTFFQRELLADVLVRQRVYQLFADAVELTRVLVDHGVCTLLTKVLPLFGVVTIGGRIRVR